TVGSAGNTFTLNALDVTSGAQRAGYPAPIAPPPSNGSTFDPRPTGERGALSLVDGRVYVPFGGLYGDCGVYHGWVVGIDTAMPSHQTSFATSGGGSGIWAVGGVVSDGAGHLFVATGDDINNHGGSAMGEYVIRLGTGATGATMASGHYF